MRTYTPPVGSVIEGRVSLVEHARGKLLYNELAPYYDLAVRRDTRLEAECLVALIARFRPGARRLLDLGCGIGRHAGALASAGFRVTGVDLSPAMLTVARERHPACRFVEGDFRSIRLGEAFDVAMIMWTTFNYLGDGKEVEAFFETVSRHLVEDGILIVDVANYAPEPSQTYDRRHRDDRHELTVKIAKSVCGGYNIARYDYSIRDLLTDESIDCLDQEIAKVYGPAELTRFGAPAFEVGGVFGDYDLSEFDERGSPRVLVVYRRVPDW